MVHYRMYLFDFTLFVQLDDVVLFSIEKMNIFMVINESKEIKDHFFTISLL